MFADIDNVFFMHGWFWNTPSIVFFTIHIKSVFDDLIKITFIKMSRELLSFEHWIGKIYIFLPLYSEYQLGSNKDSHKNVKRYLKNKCYKNLLPHMMSLDIFGLTSYIYSNIDLPTYNLSAKIIYVFFSYYTSCWKAI